MHDRITNKRPPVSYIMDNIGYYTAAMYIVVKYTHVLYTAVKYTALTQSAFIFNTGMFNPLFIVEVNIVTSVFNIEVCYILRRAMQTLQPLIEISCTLQSYAQQSSTFQYCKITDILAFVSYFDDTTS